jgi:hypothetical protein
MNRRALLAIAAAALLAVAAFLVLRGPGDGDPTPDELARAVRAVAGCPTTVREIDNIGGPGLPDGMHAAHEIACGNERLAVHYVFDGDDAARAWLRENGYVEDGGREIWRLNDGTLVGAVALNVEQWSAVLERV